jgi:membrane-associated phospholipid phosphatase
MDWQIKSILILQQNDGLVGLMHILSFLGREEFYLLFVPLIYLSINAQAGIRLGVILLLGDSLNFLLKLACQAPRPYWISPQVQHLATETSYGLPSSHAQNATSIWLFFAGLLKKPWAWLGAISLILCISFSRVYLGVHFWTDIFGGWTVGLLFILLFWRFWPSIETWFLSLELKKQTAVALGGSLLLLLLGISIERAIAGANNPTAWGSYAKEARSLQPLVGRCGALLGLGLGWALSLRWARFKNGGTFGQRFLRFIIGLIGVIVCWKGLQMLLPSEPEPVEFFFRFVRYGLLSLWITFLAPWLFLRWKLAEPTTEAVEVKNN